MDVGSTPRVAAIVVNWNGGEDTVACVASLRRSAVPVEIYVVDNASTDGSPDRVQRLFSQVRLLRLARNRGYAAGFNLGRARALDDGADFLWLLNNDTTVEPGTLAALLDADHPVRPAILAPLILDQANPDAVWSRGGWLDWRLKSYHVGPFAIGSCPHHVEWATGCSLFCSAEAARRVGPMDERYFLYLEDVDWCLRARARGVAIRLVPGARVYHAGSQSTGRLGSSFAAYYGWRNYYLLVREHGDWWQRVYARADLAWRLLKTALRYGAFPSYRANTLYNARSRALCDVARGRFGESTHALAPSPSPSVPERSR